VTEVTEGHVPDAVFEEVRERFNDKDLADLTMAIAAIKAWNRMAISFRASPGGYQPGQFDHLLERQAH
jgi:alkylhydroperoxidase family enzyme